MTTLFQFLSVAVLSCTLGIALGWYLCNKARRQQLYELNHTLGQKSLQCLETRKHLRTISGHLKSTIKKDAQIQRLRARLKKSDKNLQQLAKALQQQEKTHFIEIARLKLEVQDSQSSVPPTPDSTPEPPNNKLHHIHQNPVATPPFSNSDAEDRIRVAQRLPAE